MFRCFLICYMRDKSIREKEVDSFTTEIQMTLSSFVFCKEFFFFDGAMIQRSGNLCFFFFIFFLRKAVGQLVERTQYKTWSKVAKSEESPSSANIHLIKKNNPNHTMKSFQPNMNSPIQLMFQIDNSIFTTVNFWSEWGVRKCE